MIIIGIITAIGKNDSLYFLRKYLISKKFLFNPEKTMDSGDGYISGRFCPIKAINFKKFFRPKGKPINFSCVKVEIVKK